jgi:Fe2+ transport system protein FeoA
MLIANRKKQEELEARIELLEAKQAGLTDDEIRLLMAKKRAQRRRLRRFGFVILTIFAFNNHVYKSLYQRLLAFGCLPKVAKCD